MYLLQKMGWRPGEGLGRENHGTLEPLSYQVKLDKMGVMAKTERRKYQQFKQKKTTMYKSPPKKKLKRVTVKHPVSLLSEYAMQEKVTPPEYSICLETGPCHKKNFVYKVHSDILFVGSFFFHVVFRIESLFLFLFHFLIQ